MIKLKYNLDFEKIKTDVLSGKTSQEISLQYGCSRSLICLFCKKNKIKWPEIDLIGMKFHRLTVIKKIGPEGVGSRRQCFWLCKCSCGKERKYSTKHINGGKAFSCGCYLVSKERSRNNRLWNGCGDIHGKYWSNIKRGALRRGHCFDITIEHGWELFEEQNKKCALSGVEIKFAISTKGWQKGETNASLDRIDNRLGYIKGNVQWVHKHVNLMKQKFSQSDFIDWCKKIANFKDTNEVQT